MDRKTKADVKNKIMREAKRMAGSDRLTASDIEMARRKIMKPVKKGLGGVIKKGAKILGMKVKTTLNKRRMLKQLKKAGYDPKATSGPKTLSATIARERKENRKLSQNYRYNYPIKPVLKNDPVLKGYNEFVKTMKKKHGKFSEGGSVSRGGRAAIRGIKFSGVK